jgi:hypothetical protein
MILLALAYSTVKLPITVAVYCHSEQQRKKIIIDNYVMSLHVLIFIIQSIDISSLGVIEINKEKKPRVFDFLSYKVLYEPSVWALACRDKGFQQH